MSTEKLALHDETALPPVAVATMQKAAQVIDMSDAPRLLELWQSQDRTYRGGRPAHVSMRAVLIVWLILAMENQPMHITRVARTFVERLTPKTAELLEYQMDAFTHPDAIYDRVRSATTRIFKLVDADPLANRQRRLTKAELRAELESRERNSEDIERRRRRRDILQNAMLEATYQMLPAQYRTKNISVAVDATRVKAHARGIGNAKLEAMPDHAKVSSEPDFGFYKRNAKHQIPKEKDRQAPRIIEYALEAEFAVTGSNGGRDEAGDVPNLVLAFTVHAPGKEPSAAARRMVDSLWERGHKILHFAGDRAYLPAGDPDLLQNPLRLAGVRLVMDYPKDQLGIQQNAHGAILVEGYWYSPGMPADLINATITYRAALESLDKNSRLSAGDRAEQVAAAEALWRVRIAERSKYRFRDKDATFDEKGRVKKRCPAAGPKPLVRCAMKPRDIDSPLLQISGPKRGLPAVCANKESTTFHVSDGGSHEQYYEYQSRDWANHYNHLRNNVESFNDFVKDTATFAFAQPGRRRMRGVTAQSILMVITVAAANLKKIRQFLEHKMEQEQDAAEGKPVTEGRSRRSRKSSAPTRLTHRSMRNRGQKKRATPTRT